jgi:Na+/melibiose symporter-like transporter
LIRIPLIHTLKNLRGNARGGVYTEPLWGIPYNLYAPYASVYMLALGMTDGQIGLITSIGLVCQVFWAMLSGAITDKLGRKRTLLIFELLSWGVPGLISAVAQNWLFFAVAVIINSVWRVAHNAWQCLLVEDTDPRLLVDMYSWIRIGGQVAAFASLLTGVLIAKFDLVPTMRGLYILAAVMMSSKAIIMNAMATETRQGQIRMQETKHQPLFTVLREYPDVLKRIVASRGIWFMTGLMLVLSICRMISGTFWSILVTEKLDILPQHLAYYSFARSITIILFFFLLMPRLRRLDLYSLMRLGFLGLIVSQVILISVPARNYWLLGVATVLEASGLSAASTLLDKLIALTVDAQERARVMAMIYVVVIVFTSPFGWIAGQISEVNRSWPFVLNVILFSVGGVLTYLIAPWVRDGDASEVTAAVD